MSAWREIFEKLREDVRCGCYPRGVALPSEAALRRRWGVSRTVKLDGERFPATLSALEGIMLTDMPRRFGW